jgi:hypothetical protein
MRRAKEEKRREEKRREEKKRGKKKRRPLRKVAATKSKNPSRRQKRGLKTLASAVSRRYRT